MGAQAVAVLWGLYCVARTAGEQAPNFIFVLSESLDGRLLRPGSAAKIPNIRALMDEGVRFDAAYANSPVCAPSRSALHSGRDIHHIPHEHNGMLVGGAWNNYEGLDANYTGLLHERLAAAGYVTDKSGLMGSRRSASLYCEPSFAHSADGLT